MTARSFNIFIIFTVCLSFISHPSNGFVVIQPQNRTVNPDGSVWISCKHDKKDAVVEDVLLNGISQGNTTGLCQKGRTDCKNIIMHEKNPNEYLFIMLNIGPAEMAMTYQCEFTVKIEDLEYTETGKPTTLLPGQKEAVYMPPPPPSPHTPPQFHQLRWILIGLLALMFLYSCVITSFYVRLRCSSSRDPENATYVEMRKVPSPRNTPFDMYCR
ncbi:hypothetical protein L3Q82_017273 [Scortum barcoo]|uniref:Uncharacterized protein n=1 Tax=Scortum barcoo TaxID=214431 RepID=A0ACB8VKK6_9TELE|nr:hypothetical protein L3Q82_017273 [Scortum barcoo]